MKNRKEPETDIEECASKIEAILKEFNCRVVTEDYSCVWLADNDNEETASLPKNN